MLNIFHTAEDRSGWRAYTRDEIRAARDPGGNNVPHGRLVDLICERVKKNGWGVTDFRGTLTEERQDLACSVGVSGTKFSKYFTPHLGVVATYSRKFAARFFCGGVRAGNADEGTPLVLDYFTVDVPTLTDNPAASAGYIVDGWADVLDRNPLDAAAAEIAKRRMTESRRMEVLFRVGRAEVLPWSRVGRVDEFVRRTEGAQGWDFYKAVADLVGVGPPVKQMGRLHRLREIVLDREPDPVAEAV